MKLLRSGLLVCFTLVLFSCNRQNALKFNNNIISLENALLPSVTTSQSKIDGYIEAGNWDSLKAVSLRMEGLVNEAVVKLKDMKSPDLTGAEDFKKASLRYFEYFKGIYTGYANIASQTTDEDRNKAAEEFTSMITKKDDVLRSYQESQVRFTKANNVKLEQPKP
ncbi:MAG: hypothetical protein EOO09_13780 [Chitinophagaceae bacterium]|nr:MAG: hypothetical protein EOO09_13780 [Chitinophagaceae bacterium]